MKLIDKDKVAAEIEERLHKYEQEYAELARYEIWGTAREIRPKIEELKNFRSFLDTIELKEVNLEKEIDKIWNPRFNFGWDEKSLLSINHEGFATIAKHFYELGLKAKDVNEIIKTAEDHAYFAGSENTREKLIDKACEWLLNNVRYYSTNALGAEYMCEDFRKAMEE